MTPSDYEIAEAKRKLLEKRLAQKTSREDSKPADSLIPRRAPDSAILATFGQRSLWFVQSLQPQSPVYNMANIVHIEGNLDIEAFQKSIERLVSHHEILRTTFYYEDGELYQQIKNSLDDVFQMHTINADMLGKQIDKLIHEPFDLDAGPLIRVRLLKQSDDRYTSVIVMHHIISDHWSQDILIWKEIEATYNALTAGNELPASDDDAIQFADYALWQRSQISTETYQKQVDYWRNQLAGAPPLLQLPTDRPRPAQQQFAGNVVFSHLPDELAEQVHQLSRETNSTVFVTLLTIFYVLLSRYANQNDILIGTSIDTRQHSQMENMIGYLMNSVVLRQELDQTISFRTLLADTQSMVLEAFANQNVEFEHLVQLLNPKRDGGFNPIFQVMFVLWDANLHQPKLSDVILRSDDTVPRVAKVDLTFYAQTEADGGIMVAAEYATHLFEASTIERMLLQFQALLESAVADPGAPIGRLNVLTDEEKRLLLNEWVDTTHPFPEDTLLHEVIAHHPAERLAVVDPLDSLTYGELNTQANQLAHHLIERGVGANTLVGICAERSVAMMVGILAILRAGGAYVPVDPAYPEDRVRMMIEDAGIDILLTQAHLLESYATLSVVPTPFDEQVRYAGYPTSAPDTDVSPESLAYLIYTSGSTGRPKGVAITHRNLIHSTSARDVFYPEPVDSFLLLSSFAFDSSLVGIFWTMWSGGTLYLPPHEGEKDVLALADMIERYGITHLLTVPSLYHILLEYSNPAKLRTLTTVMVAGEACSSAVIERHYDRIPEAVLYNEYGPTEGSVWSTAWKIPPNARRVLIGKPIANVQTYVLNELMEPCPIGAVGELYVGGEGVAVGYHNRPDLTAERFVPNPFGEGRLYRTGDLVRYTWAGELDFLGRVDNQVKISGYRIEPDEIEVLLAQHPDVQEAAVIVSTGQNADSGLSLETLLTEISDTEELEVILNQIERMTSEEVQRLLGE